MDINGYTENVGLSARFQGFCGLKLLSRLESEVSANTKLSSVGNKVDVLAYLCAQV